MGYSYKNGNVKIVTNFPFNKSASKLSINKEKVSVGIDSRIISNKIVCSNKNVIIVTKPVIDRLVIRFDIKKHIKDIQAHCHEAYDDIVTGINSYLVLSVTDPDECLFTDVSNKEKSASYSWYAGYQKNLWLTHPKTKSRILVQTTPQGKSQETKPFMRLDFNPHELGTDGMKFLMNEFKAMMGNWMDWAYLSKFPKTIERMDIAVDFIGADPSYIAVHRDKAPHQQHEAKTQAFLSENGRGEALYYNYKQGIPTDTYLYNKKKEQIDKVGKGEYGEALHSRFETRIKTDLPLSEIVNVKNPLKKFQVDYVDFDMLAKINYVHVLVGEKAVIRGIDKALEVIPENERTQYAQSYSEVKINLWDYSVLWSHWPELIKGYNL